jgi:ketosteroid isomerase-like protein
MSKENVELVRAVIPPADADIAALVRDDSLFEARIGALAPLLDPDFESVAAWQGGKTYTGLEGLRKLWLDWVEPWASYHVQVDELIDAGDRVVALVRDRGRRHDTEAEAEVITGSVWEIRDGRLVRVEFSRDRKEALEAAGLSEQDLHVDA